MTAILWDQAGERIYEVGVSRGVLYQSDGSGVAWNGLIEVETGYDTSTDPVHFDGQKVNDILEIGDFEGVIRAFTYPDEFLNYFGQLEDTAGFRVTGQRQDRFSMSYRTEIGSDVSQNVGYKIHVLYNLTAVQSPRTNATLTLDPEATEFEWDITSIPEEVSGYRASSHVIFDSRRIDPYLMLDLEAILYGNAEVDARLPSMQGLAQFMKKWGRLVITDNGDGTWTAYSPLDGVITVAGDEFTIVSDTITMLDLETYEISSSELIEEDL
jgi:hypothetical protein